jgi:hypothetical protein
MPYRYSYDLNGSGGTYTIEPGITIVSCTVRNPTTAIFTVMDGRGGAFTTQPGSSHTFDISPSQKLTYFANSPAAAQLGAAQLIASDAPLPDQTTSQALPPGGIVTLDGPTTVLLAPGQTIGIDGNAGVIINNTGPIATVGPDPIYGVAALNNNSVAIPFARATQRILLAIPISTLVRGGVLDAYVTDANGVIWPLTMGVGYDQAQTVGTFVNATNEIVHVFADYAFAPGAVLTITFTGNIRVAVGY